MGKLAKELKSPITLIRLYKTYILPILEYKYNKDIKYNKDTGNDLKMMQMKPPFSPIEETKQKILKKVHTNN